MWVAGSSGTWHGDGGGLTSNDSFSGGVDSDWTSSWRNLWLTGLTWNSDGKSFSVVDDNCGGCVTGVSEWTTCRR